MDESMSVRFSLVFEVLLIKLLNYDARRLEFPYTAYVVFRLIEGEGPKKGLTLDDLVKAKLSGERCRFWPGCRQGEKCPYHHPNTPCKSFPNCKFADKCLFIHPNCKYDASCTRRDCPYTHASPRAIFTSPTAVSVPVRSTSVCRFFPKCANPACGFLHPKPCRYGQFCTKRGCTYQHDPKIPTVNQLKWSSSLRAN